jgi:hypothetical protein
VRRLLIVEQRPAQVEQNNMYHWHSGLVVQMSGVQIAILANHTPSVSGPK